MPAPPPAPDMLQPIDAPTLKALRSYSPVTPPKLGSPEQLLLQAAGWWQAPRSLSHDEALHWLIEERTQAQRASLVTAFLLGMAWERADLRVGLQAYSASWHVPDHAWQGLQPGALSCLLCGQMKREKHDLTFMRSSMQVGYLGYSPADLAFARQLQRLDWNPQIESLDAHKLAHVRQLGWQRLQAVLQFLDSRPDAETPTVLKRHLAKSGLMRWTQEHATYFIESLGYLGVLQPPGHKSFLREYITHLNPRKSGSSDWHYPVDFWLGRDGVNWEAVRFWFADGA